MANEDAAKLLEALVVGPCSAAQRPGFANPSNEAAAPFVKLTRAQAVALGMQRAVSACAITRLHRDPPVSAHGRVMATLGHAASMGRLRGQNVAARGGLPVCRAGGRVCRCRYPGATALVNAPPSFCAEARSRSGAHRRGRVTRKDVFDTENPKEASAPYRWANALHIQTRASVIAAPSCSNAGTR